MTRVRRTVLAALLSALLSAVLSATPATASPTWQEIGTSREGNPIRALLLGDPEADVRVVVLGLMHGDEPAGGRVITDLRARTPPPGTAIWLVPSMNPDGLARGTRTNARGVDLNRNFPTQWREQGSGTRVWSGPRAASEPETRAMMEFLSTVQPTAVLSFHQPYGVVDITHRPAREAGRLMARWMDMPARSVDCDGPCRGTLTEWATDELDAIALTIELDARPSRAQINRASSATIRLAQWLSDGQLSGS